MKLQKVGGYAAIATVCVAVAAEIAVFVDLHEDCRNDRSNTGYRCY
jgi:hypothetical protein